GDGGSAGGGDQSRGAARRGHGRAPCPTRPEGRGGVVAARGRERRGGDPASRAGSRGRPGGGRWLRALAHAPAGIRRRDPPSLRAGRDAGPVLALSPRRGAAARGPAGPQRGPRSSRGRALRSPSRALATIEMPSAAPTRNSTSATAG